MKTFFIFVFFSLGGIVPAFADIAVIVHPDNNVELDVAQVRNVFMGKVKVFPNGILVTPVDIVQGDPVRAVFISKILHKNESNINAYWVRMMFSAKAEPPKQKMNSSEVMEFVSTHSTAIGYVDVKDLNDTVRVIMIVK